MIFSMFQKNANKDLQQKASAATPVLAFHGAGRAAFMPRDLASLTKHGFINNPVGFRCVKMIAEAIAAAPIKVSADGTRYEAHPVIELLRRPNQGNGYVDLVEALVAQLLLSGDAYLEAAGAEGGAPKELYVLRSDRMRAVPGADGWPVAYEYKVGARKHRFDMRADLAPILHIKSFHPSDDHYGLSPIQAAALALDVHNSASRWSKALLDNAARPSGAIVYKGTDGQSSLREDQYARLVDEIEINHQGARNAGRPMLLEGGLDWKPMSLSPADMDFLEARAGAAREIALAFGVPPMLLGIPGDNTFANYREANTALWRTTILPLAQKMADALTHWLSESFEDAKISCDLDGIPALAADREAKWKRVSEADFLTRDEKRALLGLSS